MRVGDKEILKEILLKLPNFLKDKRLEEISKSIQLSKDGNNLYMGDFSISKNLTVETVLYSSKIDLKDLMSKNKMLFLITLEQIRKIFSYEQQIIIAYIIEIVEDSIIPIQRRSL